MNQFDIPKNHFGMTRHAGVDHHGTNIGFQCKSLVANIGGRLHSNLIDIGSDFQNSKPMDIDSETIKNYDSLYLTHSHYDHIGGLPFIAKNFINSGKNKHIYMSGATAQMLSPILLDMQKHQEAKTTAYNQKIKKTGEGDFISNPYTKDDIYDIMNHKRIIDPSSKQNDIYNIFDAKMSVRGLYAGHIFGANQYLFKILGNNKQKNTKILYSGDLGRFADPITFGIAPDIVTNQTIDYMIVEGTYANKNHEPREINKQKLIKIIRERKGKLLFPTFSNTRLIQLILDLDDAYSINYQNSNPQKFDMPHGAKIFIDTKLGMSLYREVCNYNGSIPGISTEQIERMRSIFEDIYNSKISPFAIAHKKTILGRNEKDIIIAGGGMGSVGPSQGYLNYFLDNYQNNKIIFTGYQAEGTNGRKIQDKQILHIGGKFFDLSDPKYANAEISHAISMSGHADQNDLLHYIDKTNKRSDVKIFIDHTGLDGLVLKDKIIDNIGIKRENIIIPEIGKTYIYPI